MRFRFTSNFPGELSQLTGFRRINRAPTSPGGRPQQAQSRALPTAPGKPEQHQAPRAAMAQNTRSSRTANCGRKGRITRNLSVTELPVRRFPSSSCPPAAAQLPPRVKSTHAARNIDNAAPRSPPLAAPQRLARASSQPAERPRRRGSRPTTRPRPTSRPSFSAQPPGPVSRTRFSASELANTELPTTHLSITHLSTTPLFDAGRRAGQNGVAAARAPPATAAIDADSCSPQAISHRETPVHRQDRAGPQCSLRAFAPKPALRNPTTRGHRTRGRTTAFRAGPCTPTPEHDHSTIDRQAPAHPGNPPTTGEAPETIRPAEHHRGDPRPHPRPPNFALPPEKPP